MLDYIIGFFDGAANTINKVASGNLGAIAEEGWYNWLVFWGNLLWWITVIVVGGVLFWHFYLRYNKKVLVKKLKGNSVIDSYMDRGRIHKDSRGKIKISLLRTRQTAPIPSHQYIMKMGKKDFFEMYLCDDNTLRAKEDVIDFIDKIREIVKVEDRISLQEMAGWRMEEMKLAEEKYKKQGFFDKYKDIFMTFMAMVAAIAIIWITVSKVQGSIFSMTTQVGEMTKAIVELKSACLG